MAPSAVLAGAPGVGKSSIIGRICSQDEEGRKQHGQNEPGAALAERRPEDESGESVWSVDTKYYTAQVRLCELQVPLPPGAALSSQQGPCAPPPGDQAPDWSTCEALVLVFDLASHGSFLALQDWWSKAGEALQASGALDVQLCVGNKADSVRCHPARALPASPSGKGGEGAVEDAAGEALEEQRRGYMEWCLDRGFEYIEASALDAGFDARIGPAEGDSVNSQGIARLRAALQAHMWSGMSLKDPSACRPTLAGAALLGIPGAGEGGSSDATGGDVSSDEDEGDEEEACEELTADELGSFLGYVQLGGGQDEEGEVEEGPEGELLQAHESGPASSSGAGKLNGDVPQHDPPEWGPFHSNKPDPTPGPEDAGEGRAGSAGEGAEQQEAAANTGPASGSTGAGPEKGTALPGPVEGPKKKLPELGGEADEEHLRSLEQLLGRVAAVREQGASLPDAARREMAAATALQFANLLCGDEDEDDDEEDA